MTVNLPLRGRKLCLAAGSWAQLTPAGVLAHEFGHFGQGAGMSLSGRIRQMNFWCARLVYERNSFDPGLPGW